MTKKFENTDRSPSATGNSVRQPAAEGEAKAKAPKQLGIKPEKLFDVLGVGILCLIFPPAAVLSAREFCSCDFWLNCFLSSCMMLPGAIHALWIIFVRKETPEDKFREKFNEDLAEKAQKTKKSKG